MDGLKAGIAPNLVVAQVKNTAAWLWEDIRASDATAALDAIDAAERDRVKPDGSDAYLRLLLAAHHATVATFVPTDVDARIRHHAWMNMQSEEEIARAADVVDEVAGWHVGAVSARVVWSDHGPLSGHDGEWLGVRAGALGRALTLRAARTAARLVTAIDAELAREARIFDEAISTGAPAERVLSAATVIAHNLGDLSRVVEQWPGGADVSATRDRYVRLGHVDAPHTRGSFVLAGTLNKAITALENHRFLPLRKPRGLRRSRALLLPIGPWLFGWGETIAESKELDDRDRAEVVTALLELHASSPDQQGCLRALAGIHRATRGGLERYVPDLPARLRKDALRGRVREAIDVAEERFRARIAHRLAIVHPRGK
jgi:hypothetical protein